MRKIGYLCLNCFEEYNKEALNSEEIDMYEYMCPRVKCQGRVVEIDDMLLPIIKLLNQKGYETTYCCSGHSYEAEEMPNTYISFRKEYIPNILPKEFILEDKEWYQKYYPNAYNEEREDICIRKYYDDSLNENKLHIEICKTMIDLIKWVQKLDDIN